MPPSPNKRRRIVDSEDLAEEQARAPHRESGIDTAQANGAPDETTVADVDQQAKDEEEEDPEEQALLERQRIWDDFQDEYFDVVDRLPLELQRNAELMMEHDKQGRKHEVELEDALLRYLAAAREALSNRTTSTAEGHANVDPMQERAPQDAGVDQSVTSEDDVRNALLPPQPPMGHTSSTGFSAKTHQDGSLETMLRGLASLSRATVQACEDKLALATIAYDTVDRHIQRLDADLLKHEEALSLGLRAGTMPSTDASEAQNQALLDAQTQNGAAAGTTAAGGKGYLPPPSGQKDRSVSRETARKHKKKGSEKKKTRRAGVTIGYPANPLLTLPQGFVPPPDEPIYCYCQQVSIGDMVGCDNEDCPKEWFHLACVGLATMPDKKDKFYCVDCAKQMGMDV